MHLRCRPHFSEPHGCAFRVLVRVLTEGAVSNDWSKTRPKTGLAQSKDVLSDCLHFCITPVSEGAFTATILFTAQNDVLNPISALHVTLKDWPEANWQSFIFGNL